MILQLSISITSQVSQSPRCYNNFDAIDYQVYTKLISGIVTLEQKFWPCTKLVEACSKSLSKALRMHELCYKVFYTCLKQSLLTSYLQFNVLPLFCLFFMFNSYQVVKRIFIPRIHLPFYNTFSRMYLAHFIFKMLNFR